MADIPTWVKRFCNPVNHYFCHLAKTQGRIMRYIILPRALETGNVGEGLQKQNNLISLKLGKEYCLVAMLFAGKFASIVSFIWQVIF